MAVGLYSGVSGLALGIGLYKNVSGLWGGSSGLINGFGGSGPFPGASLYLDFLTPPLDSRITFSRGSNATLVDATGKITYAPANVVLQSGDLTGSGTGASVTGGQVDSQGGTTAALITAFANNDRHGLIRGSSTTNPNIYSTDFKQGTHRYVQIAGSSGGFHANFDLQAGVVGTGGGAKYLSHAMTNLGNGWYRCWVVVDNTSSVDTTWWLMVTSASAPVLQIWTATGTETILMGRPQLEPVTYQTTPSTYVATTASAYYGPRFDYDPVTLAPKGLLIEEARTNLIAYSQDFANAAWSKSSGGTILSNTDIAPDGTTTADRIVGNGANFAGAAWNNASTVGVTYTSSVYVKKGTANFCGFLVDGGNRSASLDFSTGVLTNAFGVTGTAVNAGNGWFRVNLVTTVTGTSHATLWIFPADANGGFTSTGNVIAWGAQLEAGSFATSYIPTVASTVTRSADVATMTGTNFSSWYNQSAGTFVMNLTPIGMPVGANNTRFLEANDGTGNNRKPLLFATPTGLVYSQYTVTSVTQANLVSVATGIFAPNLNLRIATAYATDDLAASYNGATSVTDTSGSVSNTVTQLTIGYATSSGAEIYNGHIRAIAYYNTRLPNAQLQTLTAPSLATTLTMSFTDQAYTVGV